MATHPRSFRRLDFFSRRISLSTSLAWLYEYNCDWDVFFSLSGALKSFGSKRAEYFTDHSMSQTVIGQPRSLTPIPWNHIVSFPNADAHLHSPIIQACRFFKQSATDCERGKIVSPLHTTCITPNPVIATSTSLFLRESQHTLHIHYRTNFQLSILTYTNPLISLFLLSWMISNQIYTYLSVTQSSLSSLSFLSTWIYFEMHFSFWHKLPSWG